jgi:hypothetical protein
MITAQQAGLIAYGRNRRVPGLRREEVAMLAGVSIDYYTQLERGHARGVSEDVLDAITRRCGWTKPSAPTCSTSPAPPAPSARQTTCDRNADHGTCQPSGGTVMSSIYRDSTTGRCSRTAELSHS